MGGAGRRYQLPGSNAAIDGHTKGPRLALYSRARPASLSALPLSLQLQQHSCRRARTAPALTLLAFLAPHPSTFIAPPPACPSPSPTLQQLCLPWTAPSQTQQHAHKGAAHHCPPCQLRPGTPHQLLQLTLCHQQHDTAGASSSGRGAGGACNTTSRGRSRCSRRAGVSWGSRAGGGGDSGPGGGCSGASGVWGSSRAGVGGGSRAGGVGGGCRAKGGSSRSTSGGRGRGRAGGEHTGGTGST